MKGIVTIIGVLLLFVALATDLYAQTLAFPSARGYGRFASGGRGGVVVEVTNLQDYNPSTESPVPGSFRWAFTQGKDSVKNRFGQWTYWYRPMTVVFRVGGVIDLKADFTLNRDSVTIAGHTALGNGICFKRSTIKLSGRSNLIVRHIKSRPGDDSGEETSALRLENGGNFIIDHCSLSWGIEETTHFSSAKNFTVQWCIVSEGLYSSIHKKGDRGYAAQWGGQYASYHHNLLAHNQSRSPRINGANSNDVYALVDYRNNVNYNWGSSGACYGGEWEVGGGKGYAHTNFVNSYNQPGPGTASSWYFAAPSYARSGVTPDGYGAWYFNGNTMKGSESITNDNWLGVNTSDVGGKANIYSSSEFVMSDGTLENYDAYTETAGDAYQSVMSRVGATYPARDGIDSRIIAEMKGEIPIQRSAHLVDGVSTNPKRGLTSGIIDTPWNLKPANAADDWDPWYSYYPTIDSSNAPIDSDHDGMPDEWEVANGLNPNDPKDRNLKASSGYTALEVYLNSLVGEIIPWDGSSSIDNLSEIDTVLISNRNNILTISSSQPVVRAYIFDVLGKQVISTNETSIDTGRLPKGTYLLQVVTSSYGKKAFKFYR
jgi:hypothetical protein